MSKQTNWQEEIKEFSNCFSFKEFKDASVRGSENFRDKIYKPEIKKLENELKAIKFKLNKLREQSANYDNSADHTVLDT